MACSQVRRCSAPAEILQEDLDIWSNLLLIFECFRTFAELHREHHLPVLAGSARWRLQNCKITVQREGHWPGPASKLKFNFELDSHRGRWVRAADVH